MKQPLRTSQEGLTIIELLAALVIMGVVLIGIVSLLLSGMNSFKKVNENISLHDEANHVMINFEKYIVVAIDARDIEPCGNCSLIEVDVKNSNGTDEVQTMKLGFKNNQAVINDQVIHSARFKVVEGSTIEVEEDVDGKKERNVRIKLILEDTQAKQKGRVELDNIVSFLKVTK